MILELARGNRSGVDEEPSTALSKTTTFTSGIGFERS